jgi:hypothetical protein
MKGPTIVYDLDESDLTPEGVRDAFVVRFGPQCAAWLINKFRRKIHRDGFIQLHLAAGEEEPPWFDIAITFLKKHRAMKWSVVTLKHRDQRSYRLIWQGWQGGPKDLPASLRRW